MSDVRRYDFGGDGRQHEYTYRDRETDELVIITMSWRERCARETCGFIEFPDGGEGKYSPIAQDLHDKGCPPQRAAKIRHLPRWPMRTVLTGVGEHQVQELREFVAERKLVGVEVNDDGSLEVSDRKAWRNYCHAIDLYMRNAGYGDAAPRNR